MVIGGPRDGQTFRNARDLYKYGSQDNYSENIRRALKTPTFVDPASTLSPTPAEQLNGDVVYFQFLNGDPAYPIILGSAKLAINEYPGATKADGPRTFTRYNGVNSSIDKDGVYTWSKDLGVFDPIFQEWRVTPGTEETLKVTVDAQAALKLAYNTGLSVELDSLADKFSLTMAVGTSFLVDGASDSLALTAKFGDTLSVSAADGIQASTPSGTSLSMKSGEVTLKSLAATLTLGKDGKVALGNAAVELLAVIEEAFTALSTQTASGYGAPTSTVAKFAELTAKIGLLKV